MKQIKSSRDLLAVALLRLLALLPLRINHQLGWLLGTLFRYLPNVYRDVAAKNLVLCFPDMQPAERDHLLVQNMHEMGKTITELGPMWIWPAERVIKSVVKVSGEELLTEARNSGRGVILLTPHLGCWEMVNLYSSSRYPMVTLYRSPRNRAVEPLMTAGRERFGAKLVANSAQGVRALLKALKFGEMVMLLPDQDPGSGAGVFAPFFGHAANTMTLAARLAASSGAEVLVGYGLRLPAGSGYEIRYQRLQSPLVTDSEDGSDKVSSVEAAARLNRAVEMVVWEAPQQYQWHYRRFKSRPEGEGPLY